MTRIHPTFTPDIVDEKEATIQDMKKMIDAYAQGAEYWSNIVIDEIGNIKESELPIVIIALRAVVDQIIIQSPKSGIIADEMIKHLVRKRK